MWRTEIIWLSFSGIFDFSGDCFELGMCVGACCEVGRYEFGIPLEPDAVFVKLSDLVSVVNREDKPPDNALPPAILREYKNRNNVRYI